MIAQYTDWLTEWQHMIFDIQIQFNMVYLFCGMDIYIYNKKFQWNLIFSQYVMLLNHN